jgi:hypothetical protein
MMPLGGADGNRSRAPPLQENAPDRGQLRLVVCFRACTVSIDVIEALEPILRPADVFLRPRRWPHCRAE